jgi:diguanylate cyclase (GGDEF)-like protein
VNDPHLITQRRILAGSDVPLGATWDGSGTNFALFSAHAEKVELCLFDQLGRREVERALRFDRPLSAVMLDLDLFKRINDRHGHFVGDQVLRGLSARCKEGIREVDVFGRFGGEEFVILLVENDLEVAVAVAERLRQAVIAAPFVTSAGLLAISASFGVSTIGASITDLHTLIDAADKALYLAKQDGRNRTASLPGWPAD